MRKLIFCGVVATGIFLAGNTQAQMPTGGVTEQSLEALNRKLGELSGIDDNLLKMIEEKLKTDPDFRKKVMEYKGIQDKFKLTDTPDSAPRSPFAGDPPTVDPSSTRPTEPSRFSPPPTERQSRPTVDPAPPPPIEPNAQPGRDPRIPPQRPVVPTPNAPEIPKFAPFPGMFPEEVDPNRNGAVPNNPLLKNLMKHWEQNIGPLDQTPELKKALVDLFSNRPDLGDNPLGKEDFWKDLQQNPEVGNFAEWLKESTRDTNWKFPDLKIASPGGPSNAWNWAPNWRVNNPFTGDMQGSGGWMSGQVAWIPIALILLAIGSYLVRKYGRLFRFHKVETAFNPLSLASGGWPVDPRRVADRTQLVKAFEYISIQLCGSSAKVWNHFTIATALRRLPTGELVADELANLYELARYSPASDPLTETDFANARKCLCELAGVNQG